MPALTLRRPRRHPFAAMVGAVALAIALHAVAAWSSAGIEPVAPLFGDALAMVR